MRSRGSLLAVLGMVVLSVGAVYAFITATRTEPPSFGPEIVVTATPDPAATTTGEPDKAHPVKPAPSRDDDDADDTDDSDDDLDDDDDD